MNYHTINESVKLVDKINSFNIKIETCTHELEELMEFLQLYPIICPGRNIAMNDLLQAKLLSEICLKLKRKLTALTTPKSIRFNYYEMAIIKHYFMAKGRIEVRVNYPQMVRLVTKIDNALPPFH